MEKSSVSSTFDLVVVGAGIAGLTAAFRARQAGRTVLVLEKSGRPGGVIRSERKHGFLIEHGPNTVQPQGELMSLIEDLHLHDQILLADHRLPRYIRYRQKLYAAPLSPAALLNSPLLSLGGRARLLIEPFIGRLKNGTHDESLMAFAGRRFGKEMAERLLAPFVSGIWAGDARELSAKSAFPKLVQWEKTSGSVIRGMMSNYREKKKATTRPLPKGLLSFRDGLETLPVILEKAVFDSLRYESHVSSISMRVETDSQVTWTLNTSAGIVQTRAVLLCLPSHQSAPLIEPLDSRAALALKSIPYAPIAIAYLGFKRTQIPELPKGFGYLCAPSDGSPILGCIISSNVFPHRAPADSVLLTVFMGGSKQPDITDQSDEKLLRLALAAVSADLGISGNPTFEWFARSTEAIPQYTQGHAERIIEISECEKKFPGLKFAGNYMEGISVGDVIRQATIATEAAI